MLASAGFLLITLVAVGQFLRVVGSFADTFKELGAQVPQLTALVLEPWFHVLSGSVLMVLIFMRHRHGMKEWLTAVWVVMLLVYIAITHAGLFEPLIRLVQQLGEKASG